GTGLDASNMESCVSYDSDADETYFFDWEDFEGGDALGGSSSDNAINDGVLGVTSCTSFSYGEYFGGSENDVQTKTDYSGHKENIGGKTYERIDWKVGDKVKICADGGVKFPKTECIYEVSHVRASGIRSSAGFRPFNEADGHGLMWDSGNADFYAFYPGDSPAKVFAYNDLLTFDVTVRLPEGQNTFTKTTSGNHTEVKPDMELAAMMAVSRNVPPASSVQLDFLPLVTTFRITIGNPSTTDDMTINKVSIGYSPLSSTPVPISGDYSVMYDKVGGSTLSSHLQLMPVYGPSVQNASFNGSVDLSSVSGGEVFLPKKNGSTVSSMSVTLFAIPLMHKGLQLKINVTQGGNTEDRILYLEKKQTNSYAPADQLEFEPYKKYDINVGIGNRWTYHLEATDISVAYNGGPGSSQLKSYKTDGVTTNSASWWVEGYSETGSTGPFTTTPPAWLTGITPHGNGVSNPTVSEPVTASVSAQTPTVTLNARTTALRGKSEVGTQSEPIDLSRVPVGNFLFFSIADGATASTYAGNPMNTANCYVVTRPGWYKIPVVYGNAIKNNIANISAYTSSASGGNVFQNFIRHDRNAITDPWIKANSGINLNNGVAELLWQDSPFLVQDIQLESNKKFIVFHVSQANIHEGNAVIALKSSASGDIVWSWHIWVYGGDDLMSINVKNNKAKSGGRPGEEYFNFLSENLGACYDSGESMVYPESNVWVKISNGRKTNVIKITRTAGPYFTTAAEYNSPYYQWGRKDPMLPSDGTNNNKFWYDKVGTISNDFPTDIWDSDGSASQANAEIANTIKNPQTFNTSPSMDNLYYNLWDTKCNETSGGDITTARFESVTKSVYDPCPPGFCLPPNGAFTGFTESGNNSSNSSEWNVSGSFDKGWLFNTTLISEPPSDIIFFPASGFRMDSNNGVVFFVSSGGSYSASNPFSSFPMYVCYLSFHTYDVLTLAKNSRAFGCALRPVAEN
ncbi:MAG: hypothetical protein ACTTK1_02945, partial [Candidatus Cryptobacteroides sp.]